MHIKFQRGVNLLIGDNGVGKTSVLEAITVAFGDFINGMTGIAKKGIAPSDVRMDTKMISDASQGKLPEEMRQESQKQDFLERKLQITQIEKRIM